jgi:hypothetical protein
MVDKPKISINKYLEGLGRGFGCCCCSRMLENTVLFG